MAHGGRNNPKYVYDLPYFERMELCRILDQNDKWEELGGIYMHFDVLTIQMLRREILRGNSPADELLTKWGHQNHTILELFVLLSKMQHYQAMLTIKQFVDPEYHRLIFEGEQNLSRLFQSRSLKDNLPASDENDRHVSPPPYSGVLESHLQGRDVRSLNPSGASGCDCDRTTISPKQGVRSPERKILNNEAQPGKSKPIKNGNAHTIQCSNTNREENAVANEATDLLRPKYLKGESTKSKNISEISSLAESVGILPLITFKELEIATNGWDQSAILGKGGFGTVYKGTWKNTQVAIKRTKDSDTDENRTVKIQQILGELKMLNSYRHDNILPLYGFSLGAEEPCLVYQFMPNGSLEDRLLCRQGTKPLTWFQRHNIATGTARGLQFLHTIGEKPLIHGDIKSANILLDSNFEPKIGDFGLAREGPYSQYTHMKVSKVHGTRPYLPDEFLRHKKFSTKVDTHSFGIVLFELATGLRAYDDQRNHKFLKDLVDNSSEQDLVTLMDKKCGPDEHQTFTNLIVLGKCCASRKPKDRPEMVTVLQELNAMAVKRDTIVKVQNMMKLNSVSPINPFEMQVIHDHLSNQKKISPASNVSALHRAVSPLQPLETTRPASPVINENHLPSPFLDPVRSEHAHRKELRSNSPNPPEQEKNMDCNPFRVDQNPQNIPELRHKPPVISVSPPSAPLSSNMSASEASSEGHDTNGNAEDFDYNSSQFDNILPLISELGIKKSDKNPREESESSNKVNAPEIRTTAEKKPLWILDDPA